MPTSLEEIQAAIDEAVVPGFRGRLIARGQARAIIWRDGILPQNAPAFSPQLSYDLHSYGYSLLHLGLQLKEKGEDATRARTAFEQAATALEAVMAKGDRTDSDRDFHFVMAASAYHLAQLSARAYSMLMIVQAEDNFSPIERALALLMLRDVGALQTLVLTARNDGSANDATITDGFAAHLQALGAADAGIDDGPSSFLVDGVDVALTDNFFGAIALVLTALERGERNLLEQALERLGVGLRVCTDLNLLPQWWAHRVAVQLLSDLWGATFHERLPSILPGGDGAAWAELRQMFIASLLRRGKAEIDLWPSQISAAARAVDQSDDLVVSLPTSAGKTRIAELCILRCLAAGKRVFFITPLRALSAQTEVTLQRSFGPLGKSISALYGSIGASGVDEDAIRERNIVVATPEKLDFALRNDPTLLDDVGLLVFDEGHMIGEEEREVRYEVQIQRLLRRPDAPQRRIVCLSAILPDGDQLDDFANWLRRDQPGGIVKSEWRPTRLRFGEVLWNGHFARLNFRVGAERPWVPRYFTGFVPPDGGRKAVYPRDLGELCVATAWQLVAEGHTVLVFCPVRSHVDPFAPRILDLHRRGAIPSLLAVDPAVLRTAETLGAEWLGPNHPILKCLRLGVAIHHAALPTAFRKEIERLLRDGVLKVTISSPTLAQGLNLSASALIFHSLSRNKQTIKASEFKNVIGRAGRAFVDIEGLVLYPMFDKHDERTSKWEALIADATSKEMESGLVRLLISFLIRLHKSMGGTFLQLVEYVVNQGAVLTFPDAPREKARDRDAALKKWKGYVATLDTAILGLIGENVVADDQVAAAVDDILQSSLWARCLTRRGPEQGDALRSMLVARGQLIWAQSTAQRRRGYFLAGIGLGTGLALDAIADACNQDLVTANGALLNGDNDLAIGSITAIAERVFQIFPFTPDDLPANWQGILRGWLLGESMAAVAAGYESQTLQFVEGGLVYRLPWAMEAIRVRGVANGDVIGDFGMLLDDFELSYAVAAVETGTLNRSASILIQAGFNSRLAAIKAVTDTAATFDNFFQLKQWLASPIVIGFTAMPDWPTAETKAFWLTFLASAAPREASLWKDQRFLGQVTWSAGVAPPVGTPLRLHHVQGQPAVLSADGLRIGTLNNPLNEARAGVTRASVNDANGSVFIQYLGPSDLWL